MIKGYKKIIDETLVNYFDEILKLIFLWAKIKIITFRIWAMQADTIPANIASSPVLYILPP